MKEEDVEYYQLDLTDKSKSISLLKDLQNNESLIIGIEVTDVEASRYCHLSIDPQHTNTSNSNITAIEMIYKYRDKISKMTGVFKKCAFITVKPDIDSIGSMVVATLAMCHNIEITGDILLRLIAIANSDRHGSSSKWNRNKNKRVNHFNEPLFSKHGIPIGLLSAIGSQYENIESKVKYMTDYILTGNFEKSDHFTAIMLKKKEAASKSPDIHVIVENKLVYVKSNYRGAIGLGYRYAPVVLAMNPSFKFGLDNKKGMRYTIAQFNSSHVDMTNILNRLNSLEAGWGGDGSTIIGSSQSEPSKLKHDQILDIIKQEL